MLCATGNLGDLLFLNYNFLGVAVVLCSHANCSVVRLTPAVYFTSTVKGQGVGLASSDKCN